ncbi:MAG: hypothetical protein UT19_C0007G0084 [Candidatus Woesebacteria bacterium GW2011_GWB1_39_10b]|uniref:Uncharacterized protein n=3 Tax=Candidatus Woeseibacteriota TaxID=1752722 RepID=A0A0G0NCP8_9BACT|nr:MAG: hypothetical protein US72_C0008G0041 [Microgenomates group bacterium GW2011_GWC1_38_12]KKQ93840.1 MAG: hypothetical protein UT19_C0007G0084 [Candidatus Woesebacteria bacterium GW2011_GWB1_39_10b]KKR13258.1 MAG: hypothetical protein UT40_C0021G0040 [Candidatus Woesebacteria bacterium GW2011_GWA1_39_21b]OGM64005.1 MAG: hypothetical protein A3A52_04965 [Candidatus Woesebacteria bacterium RIFCSPLOWO2_01_FULL_39_14]
MNKALVNGILATTILLTVYITVVSLVSGWIFAQEQFRQFWYFVVTLAIGFGVQVGLYSYLKSIVKGVTPSVVATSGVTSTVAMVSCCAHYLVNILPILGAVGIITVISQYQIQLFWVGLAFNFAGISYMANKVVKATRHI